MNEAKIVSINTVKYLDHQRKRQVPVMMFSPGDIQDPLPAIIFSHGAWGVPIDYSYFLSFLASMDYFVIAPFHVGSTRGERDSIFAEKGWESPFMKERLSEMEVGIVGVESINRAVDITFALNRILRDYSGLMDAGKIGMFGHSYGARTTLWKLGIDLDGADYADSRISCGVALAPSLRRIESNDFDIKLPTMLIAGRRDGICPARQVQEIYRKLPNGDKQYVELSRCGHLSFTNNGIDVVLESIKYYLWMFFDCYLKRMDKKNQLKSKTSVTRTIEWK